MKKVDLIYRQLPNSLTVLRLFLAAAFFLVLNQYRYHYHPTDRQTAVVFTSIVLFILGALTDALDGYLARRWHVESSFGRIMDPFCDKVLVIGAFIFLSGPHFVIPDSELPRKLAQIPLNMVTQVYPWMVAIILARELLVTGLRGELEGHGIAFPAQSFGKLKMILQSAGVPIILWIVWLDPATPGRDWLEWVQFTLVYIIVLVTFISGWPYVISAVRLLRRKK